MNIHIGDEAPDFSLKESGGHAVRLSDFQGRQNVVLVFFPFAFTGVCQGELCQLRDDLSLFEATSAQVLAISCDSSFVQRRWATEQHITFPLLSDFWPHGEVSRRYGVLDETLGCPNRTTFVIDRERRVVDTFGTDDLYVPRQRAAYELGLTKLLLPHLEAMAAGNE